MTNEEADNVAGWNDMDGATAFTTIERAAENWQEVGAMMEAWLRARTAQGVPEGWMLVPVEPTQEMLNAMVSNHKRLGVSWCEVLDAAPECTRIAHTPDEHTNQSASSSS